MEAIVNGASKSGQEITALPLPTHKILAAISLIGG